MGTAVEVISAPVMGRTECLRGVRELERPVDAVVVRERERLVPELRGARSELLRLRRPVGNEYDEWQCNST